MRLRELKILVEKISRRLKWLMKLMMLMELMLRHEHLILMMMMMRLIKFGSLRMNILWYKILTLITSLFKLSGRLLRIEHSLHPFVVFLWALNVHAVLNFEIDVIYRWCVLLMLIAVMRKRRYLLSLDLSTFTFILFYLTRFNLCVMRSDLVTTRSSRFKGFIFELYLFYNWLFRDLLLL